MSLDRTETAIATAAALAEMLSDSHLLAAIAGQLTCREAGVTADFIATWITPSLAVEFLTCHAESDEEGDEHHDPADLLAALRAVDPDAEILQEPDRPDRPSTD